MFGYHSFDWHGLRWRSLPYGCALLSPPRKAVNVETSYIRKSFFHSHPDCFYVRWENNFDAVDNSSWWHIIKDQHSGYTLESYNSKVRNQVRRGMKSYYCKPISIDLVSHNYTIYSRAFDSYDTFDLKCSELTFKENLRMLPTSTEFWGLFAVDGDDLIGFSENYIDSDTCFFNSIWILPSHLQKYAAYVLFYEMILNYLGDRQFDYVSDGAKSLSHDTQIHKFLVSKFRFRKAYSLLCVEYISWLKILVVLVYPFRGILSRLNFVFAKKLSVLMNMESIRRLCDPIS